MGSPYFYLEPHLVLLSLLQKHYQNPALFSLDYDLVPDKTWPTQLEQVAAGYSYVLSLVSNNPDRVCLAGDSAGGTLVLTLLLQLAKQKDRQFPRPGFATLLSPWVTLITENNRDNDSDFLNADSLHLYASQYAGSSSNVDNPLVSPGSCKDTQWWKDAMPSNGVYITFGSKEILAPEMKSLIKLLRSASIPVSIREEQGAVHAWVIANLFLADSFEQRIFGMREVVKAIVSNIQPLEKLIY
jgi:acetyl esterase/lipase